LNILRSQITHEIVPPQLKHIKRKNTRARRCTAVKWPRNRIKGPTSQWPLNRPGWVTRPIPFYSLKTVETVTLVKKGESGEH